LVLLSLEYAKLIEGAIVGIVQINGKNQNSSEAKDYKNKTKSGSHGLISTQLTGE
jgi:hypothetical protein